MHRLLALSLLVVPALSFADVDQKFARLRDAAEPLGALGTFLDNYIGECQEPFADASCKANSAKFRAEANKKKFYMIVTEDQVNMLSPGGYNPSTGEYIVNIAPMFAAGGYAVTHGAPKKTDANGNPIMMYLQAHGEAKEGWSAPMFTRMFSTRALRMQVVFTPKSVWSLPKKGGGKLYGVNAKVEAILVSVGRTGEQVALWMGK